MNLIIPSDNRTRIEPEQKQRDRKCPVFKAFQSLNVPNLFRGTPHYPQRAKSSIPTILTSHCKTTLQNPSGTAAQFHSTFRSGNPDNPISIASHITVSSYTAALSQCHFRSIIQSIPHTLQHQEISTFRSVTHALVVSQQTHAVVLPLPISRCCLRSVLYKSESLCERGSDGEKEQQQRYAAVCALLLTG